MSTPLITALSGMVGSVVGVSASVAVAWIKQKQLDERELRRDEIRKRETLYGEFIGECARLLVDAFQHTLEKPETLLGGYALLNRIRLCATPHVLACAERLLRRITDQYFSPNRSLEELRELAHSTEADPLREFGEACRSELQALSGTRPHSLALRPSLRRSRPLMGRSPISNQTPTVR
jgi:hypothetical protein